MSLPSKKTIVLILLFILPVIASATYATYRHSAFVIGDGKDIDLYGQAIGNGSFTGYIISEKYESHLGVIDNFTTTIQINDATVTNATAINHQINVTSGVSPDGDAVYQGKSSYTLSSKPIVINVIFQDFNNGTGGSRYTFVGMKNSIDYLPYHSLNFYAGPDDLWYAQTGNGITQTQVLIETPRNGSLLSIYATNSRATFLVNGSIVARITTTMPTAPMYPWIEVVNFYLGDPTTSNRTIGIDYFSFEKYY